MKIKLASRFWLTLSLTFTLSSAFQISIQARPYKNSTKLSNQTDTLLLADPTIFADKGQYYLYGTSSKNGFLVYQSSDLKNWKGPVGKNKGLALSKGASFGTKGFWAPQVFKFKGQYYMAYTAD